MPRFRRSPEAIFAQVFFVALLLGAISIIKSNHDASPYSRQSVAGRSLVKRDQECRLVHSQPDQCAFVKANCPDEEAGLLSYLQLYYCSLANAKPLAFIIMAVWISVLFSTIGIAASDFLCLNLSTISAVMGMSESLAGVTFLAFGNGSPDVFSTFAAFSSHSGSLAVGELMGAAGFITCVVAGSMAITKPFRVAKKSFVRDVALFAVAAGFSLVFLRDGSLRMWESIVMIVFYLCYVIFVVLWHWYYDRRRRVKLAETTARSHQHIPDQQELDIPRYEDDEESRPAAEQTPLIRTGSGVSLHSTYTPGTPAWIAENVDDVDDETRDQYLATLASNMRVSRPSQYTRTTANPIRPSLIGALEFRSILNALEKKSTTSQPIYMRRYSDEGRHMLERVTESAGSVSHPQLLLESSPGSELGQSPPGSTGRPRAVSANDAWTLGIQRNLLDGHNGTPETAIYTPGVTEWPQLMTSSPGQENLPSSHSNHQYNQNLLLSPMSAASIPATSGSTTPTSMTATRNGLLAPPHLDFHRPEYFDSSNRSMSSNSSAGNASPGAVSPLALVPKLQIPHHGSKQPQEVRFTESPAQGLSPFSRPPSMHLPPPSMSPESNNAFSLSGDTTPKRQLKWWPYRYLPAPDLVASTLFPGLYEWSSKSWPDRLLAVCTAPSIFLLTITVPVVEDKSEDETVVVDQRPQTPKPDTAIQVHSPAIVRLPSQSPEMRGRALSNARVPQITTTNTDDNFTALPTSWNRWLACIQAFTAPLFVVAIIWINLDDKSNTMLLVTFISGSLVFSLIALAVLMTNTTPDREPKHKPVMCFMGFFVAIAWISTIASEVVGVLKGFGVILNISDAILGLTIFAVGNSLGDLVADITVARLGYPMMALSACFGGPMLNILLGIGIGGLYQTVMHAQHKHQKHPEKPIKYKPFELEVSSTLLISGATLVFTLIVLLIVVPLNKWRMDRKIGAGLIAIWATSTILNVILEITGVGQTQ